MTTYRLVQCYAGGGVRRSRWAAISASMQVRVAACRAAVCAVSCPGARTTGGGAEDVAVRCRFVLVSRSNSLIMPPHPPEPVLPGAAAPE